jgi:hypothetical protein
MDWHAFDAELTGADREALVLSMRLARSQGNGEQLDRMLEGRPWAAVASFAAYSCQIDFLRLMPWQQPPCDADIEPVDPDGCELLERMLAHGVSRYHPDPERAIAAAEAALGGKRP